MRATAKMRVLRFEAILATSGLAAFWILKRTLLPHLSLFSYQAITFLALFWISPAYFLLYRYAVLAQNRTDQNTKNERELKVLRAVINSLPDRIYVKDRQSRFILANCSVRKFSAGSPEANILGCDDFSFFPRDVAAKFFKNEQTVMRTGQPMSHARWDDDAKGNGTWTLTTKVPYKDEDGTIVGLIGIGRDITAQKNLEDSLVEAREEMRYKATHDALTSLLNRGLILDLLGRELSRARRENGCTIILLADIDHFKLVNDTHGHVVGDEVLREVARRLLASVRSYDFVGRYGGEEFLLVLNNSDRFNALDRAEDIRKSICSSAVDTSDGAIPITTSIGVLTSREWGFLEVEEILREVDRALYAAKAAGRNCCQIISPKSAVQHHRPTTSSKS
jgi:diguanylate cyclase (GGDEF)-like protein/PAS domain S-box-containing protein